MIGQSLKVRTFCGLSDFLGQQWKSQTIQTFFPNIDTKFFAVIDNNPPPSSNFEKMKLLNQMLESAKLKDKELRLEKDVVKEDKGKTENSPWLDRTDWKSMFLGRDMKRLVGYTNKDVALEPELQLVKDSVHRVIEKGLKGVKDLDARGWNEIRFWLRSHQKDKPHGKPFRKYYVKTKDYANVWMQLILFCWRTFELPDSGAEFLPEQRECLIQLRDIVCLQDVDNKKLDSAVLALTISLIEHSDFQKKRSVIKYFGGVLGYKLSESRWRRPAEYTPTLAALQFCVRVLSLEHHLPSELRDRYIYDPKSTPLTVFQEFHSLWLIDGAGCPFSHIHKLLNYGMGASKDATGGDKLRFSDDGYCFYDGHGFEISKWKEMIKNIHRRAECILSRRLLFRDSDKIELINPYMFVDSEGNFNNDDYFATTIPDHEDAARRTVMDALMKSEKWDQMMTIEDGQLVFLAAGVDEYTKDDTEFRELIVLAINWTDGLTGRGTEILSLLFKNKMAAGRNLIILNGQFMVLTEYHKSQAIMDDIKVCFDVYECSDNSRSHDFFHGT